MATMSFMRCFVVAVVSFGALLSCNASVADETRIVFDLPDTIECRDVTPEQFAAAHASLKVIEGKFRISARISEGIEGNIVDFLYIVDSPSKRMKIQDYLPNTTLESVVANDQIEVVESSELATSSAGEAGVSYRSLAASATKSRTSATSDTSRYKKIAPKKLVLASGTVNREHGVFFKLRPSTGTSLEGAKDFTFLATVPKAWRGDWCTVSCAARANSGSFFSKTYKSAGVERSQIGMYLAGDHEAADCAEEFRKVQESNATVLDEQLKKNEVQVQATMYEAVKFLGRWEDTRMLSLLENYMALATKGGGDAEQKKLEEAKKAVLNVQERLTSLSGSRP